MSEITYEVTLREHPGADDILPTEDDMRQIIIRGLVDYEYDMEAVEVVRL